MADAELVSQVAGKLGWPEVLVERSAEARAKAEGVSADEVLRVWAGGGTVEAPPAPPEADAPPEEAPEEEAPEEEVVRPEPVGAPEEEPAPVRRRVMPPPLREPTSMDRPVPVVSGSLGLFVVGVLLAVLLPAAQAVQPTELALVWRNYPAFAAGSSPAEMAEAEVDPEAVVRGRTVYLREGCAYCHTQAVRPIITDADLSSVTRPGDLALESPHLLGFQRIGPDLMHVGARQPTDEVAWVVDHLRDPRAERPWSIMPSYAHLSDEDLLDLAHYLVSLKGGEPGEPEPAAEEEAPDEEEVSDEEEEPGEGEGEGG